MLRWFSELRVVDQHLRSRKTSEGGLKLEAVLLIEPLEWGKTS